MVCLLRNTWMEVEVLPERGGRIDQITDLSHGKSWLWHPDDYAAGREIAPGREAGFDDYWTGGMEEMFPNDAAVILAGQKLEDHGEWWSRSWQLESQTPTSIALSLQCDTVPVLARKYIVLETDRPVIVIRYELRNQSDCEQPFMLKLHPALAIEPGDVFELPDCQIEPVSVEFSQIAGQASACRWPDVLDAAGNPVPVNVALPPETGLREFVYCSELTDAHAGIRSIRTGSHLEFLFSSADFPFVWLFQSYGGFGGRYVAMIEPCTSKPWDLNDCIAQGTAAWLPPGTVRNIDVQIVLNR